MIKTSCAKHYCSIVPCWHSSPERLGTFWMPARFATESSDLSSRYQASRKRGPASIDWGSSLLRGLLLPRRCHTSLAEAVLESPSHVLDVPAKAAYGQYVYRERTTGRGEKQAPFRSVWVFRSISYSRSQPTLASCGLFQGLVCASTSWTTRTTEFWRLGSRMPHTSSCRQRRHGSG